MSPRGAHVAAALVLAGLLSCFTPEAACAGAPTERLRGFFAGVDAVLTDPATDGQPLERIVRVRRLVAEVADFPSAAALALGRDWSARTPAERDEFVGLYAELLERAYIGRLAKAARVTGRITITYVREVIEGETATVSTTLRELGHVEYHMTLRNGRWQVQDIVLDGVSVADNYRAQFTRLLQRDSYGAVVRAMRAKLAEESLMFTAVPRASVVVAEAPPGPAVAPRVEGPGPVAIGPRPELPAVTVAPRKERQRPAAGVTRGDPAAPARAAALTAQKPGARRAETVARARPDAVPVAFARPSAAQASSVTADPRPAEPPATPSKIVLLAAVVLALAAAGGAFSFLRR